MFLDLCRSLLIINVLSVPDNGIGCGIGEIDDDNARDLFRVRRDFNSKIHDQIRGIEIRSDWPQDYK